MPLHFLSSLFTKKKVTLKTQTSLTLLSMAVVTWYNMRGLNEPPPLGNRVIKYIPCPALTWGLEMYYEAHWLRYAFPSHQVSGSFHPQFPQQYPKEIKHNITLKKKESKLTILLKIVFCYQNCSGLMWEKIVLVIEKKVWNSRLKVDNLQNFWDH